MKKYLLYLLLLLQEKIEQLNEKEYNERRKSYLNEEISIINYGKYFSDKQLYELFGISNIGHSPSRLIILNNRKQLFKLNKFLSQISFISTIFDKDILFGETENIYLPYNDVVIILEYAFNEYNTIKEKQKEIIKTIYYSFRLKGQEFVNYANEETDAEAYASQYLISNKNNINKIMEWK